MLCRSCYFCFLLTKQPDFVRSGTISRGIIPSKLRVLNRCHSTRHGFCFVFTKCHQFTVVQSTGTGLHPRAYVLYSHNTLRVPFDIDRALFHSLMDHNPTSSSVFNVQDLSKGTMLMLLELNEGDESISRPSPKKHDGEPGGERGLFVLLRFFSLCCARVA